MSTRNRQMKLRSKRHAWRMRQLRAERRGVLLLVVLSLLVLFMLIGTAFLMSSNQYRHSAKASAKLNRLGNYPTKLLDRALMQVLRDTGEPDSSVRFHSLLRDLYGSDGFEAQVYSFAAGDVPDLKNVAPGCTVRYSGATPSTTDTTVNLLGPTQGQFIDLFVKQLQFGTTASIDDPHTRFSENTLPVPDPRHVIRLERDPNGQPQQYPLSLTKGYYNGALLTITSGPAAGQSTRIIDYENIPWPTATPQTRLFRFRVMAFPRTDGAPLLVDQSAARAPEISDLAGATFIVNGRPFNGTGIGFNELARAFNPLNGQPEPRLNSREGVQLGTVSDPDPTTLAASILNPEIALTPNAAYHFTADPYATNTADDLWGARYLTLDPSSGDPVYSPLNPKNTATVPVANRGLYWKYQNFAGPGDADESYDAADYQNMALALQTVSPRSRGRYVQGNAANPTTLDVDDPAVSYSQFLRLDLEDLPIPSFHRPDLVNYWFHKLAQFASDPTSATAATVPTDDAVWAVLAPYGADGIRDNLDDPTGVSIEIRDQIVAIKRKISLRPLREDHPNFDGSNPSSRPLDLKSVSNLVRNGNIAVPYWEAVGPWDVDNDNDGVPDSVWVDLGDPVAQAEDGTLYKPMYAFLIVDMDSKLNVNAHGLVDHVRRNPLNPLQPPPLDSSLAPFAGATGYGNLSHDVSTTGTLFSSDFLPSGSGYGPAEISLRPVFSPNLPGNATTLLDSTGRSHASVIGNPANDDYARLLAGRPATGQQPSVWGRHGSVNVRGNATADWTDNTTAWNERDLVRPGIPFNFPTGDPASVDRLALFKFFGHPWWPSNFYGLSPVASSFSTPPDMMGRYAVGLDYVGQPVVETRADHILFAMSLQPFETPLLFDSPYELNLSGSSRRETPDPSMTSTIKAAPTAAVNDDAPFATAELERISRAHDSDTGALPDRLWNVVDAFDPIKLRDNQPALVAARLKIMFSDNRSVAQIVNDNSAPTAAKKLAAAQQITSENRRLVTTDSYDLPTPGASFLPRLVYGADGQPGQAGVNDNVSGTNPDSIVDNDRELGWRDSDDWYAVMNRGNAAAFNATTGEPTPAALGLRLVPDHPTIVDLLKYRIQYERRRIGGPPYADAELNTAAQYLLPPEVIAGKKLDLNRPFGDGVDNGDGLDNDGINGPDDAGEANYPIGDSRRDRYMNGIVDDPEEAGEPFVDNNLNGRFDVGEYFFDVIGGGGAFTDVATDYNGPRDRLWPDPSLTNEWVTFDYTHGGDTWDGRMFDGNGDGDYSDLEDGRLRNNGIIQRQTFARHLYCLMMLLVDEDYVASQNMRPDNNFNVSFLDDKGNFDLFILHQQLALEIAYKALWDSGQLNSSTNTADPAFKTILGTQVNNAKLTAYLWMLRKLSAKKIAQWAINTVDYRDADSIMTPFEYDENPFDGWGCTEYDPTTGAVIRSVPIDGDIATNENWGDDFPAPRKFDPSRPINTDWTSDDYNDDNDFRPAPVFDPAFPKRLREETTRGVVWGTERPELLITETLALHDRRCTDDVDPAGMPPHAAIASPPANPSLAEPPDFDLDQKQKPRGSLFVELYNPWSPDSSKPAELYGKTAGSGEQQGVMLNKLSTQADTVSGKRSPVWRMAVLYDPFTGRLSNQVINPTVPASTSVPSAVEQAAKQVLSTDPDGYGIEMDQNAERFVYFTSGDDYMTVADKSAGRALDESDSNRADDNTLTTDVPGDLADYQEVTIAGTPIYRPEMDQLSVWVPPLPIRWSTVPGSGSTVRKPYPAARRYFLARTERYQGMPPTNDRDVSISPILPGRYAVVGASGLQLNSGGLATGVASRYVTPISQLLAGSLLPDWDRFQREHLLDTRRIELWPNPNGNPNQTDPNAQQVLVGENGGPEFLHVDIDGDGRVEPNEFVNATDSQIPGDGIPNNTAIDPAVAIPIEDLNVSEPVEGYPSLTYQKEYLVNNPTAGALNPNIPFQITADGEYIYQNSFDRPLDMEFELTRNGTTQNYRTLHLQRLANPSLPWNPPPFDDNGTPTFLHRPWLPVNPYLTVDSQSVDLTAYNSATQFERDGQMPVVVPVGSSGVDPNLTPAIGDVGEALQGNFFAPLTPAELADAPDHVLWAFIFMLKQETLDDTGVPQAPIVAQDVWMTPDDIRAQIENDPSAIETNYLEPLSRSKGSTDSALRTKLIQPRTDGVGRAFTGQWCWHMFRRVLPDDTISGNGSKTGTFRQWLHMKSLERGSQDRAFFTQRVPYSPFYKKYDTNNDGIVQEPAPFGWSYDPNWTPRNLWQQTRPNARLFMRTPSGLVEASDLENTHSRRLQRSDRGAPPAANDLTPEEDKMRMADDDIRRNQEVWLKLRNGLGSGGHEHVVDYVLEQSLGFANETFIPDLDRFDVPGSRHYDASAVLTAAKFGAPEIARNGSRIQPVSETPGLQDPNAILMPDNIPYDVSKEELNAPRLAAQFDPAQASNVEVGSLMQSLSDVIRTGPPATAALATQDKAKLESEFYNRRQRLMKSTYPWLSWNDRPFTSADELMQVPAWSSSLMLHEYTVANSGTRIPYTDGEPFAPNGIVDDGRIYDSNNDGNLYDEDGVRVSAMRYSAQQAPFGHVLNFFLSASIPARITNTPSFAGAPNYNRILEFVEVPSRYVGTDTLLTPEVFNDVPTPLQSVTPEVGTDITGVNDPRYAFQPPFNKVSRERDPGRVNLNMVTGRRQPGDLTGSGLPPLHWSEVYDGMMHRSSAFDPTTGMRIRADGNLFDTAGNLLQLSQFGPSWRDVVLSRRGYAQFNADQPLTYTDQDTSSVDKLAAVPDVFALGMSKDFPSVFSNPFRAADAGNLVPLDQMVKSGVEATWLRSHPYARANGTALESAPFARNTTAYSRLAWGIAGVDDDQNGIVDDAREAGFGGNTTPPTATLDGDQLQVDDWKLKALNSTGYSIELPSGDFQNRGSSGIPLFAESLPEPAIDAERNPGMMYQPMTRLANMVTTRSNVYAIWITVGYFEVEKAPDWSLQATRERFGGTTDNAAAATVRARALYDRVYPEGYMLGEELGTDTGSTNRQRAYYIIDRTEPVGFKPGEDLNVENMIRVRRRIE